jgi:hypothetical protein
MRSPRSDDEASVGINGGVADSMQVAAYGCPMAGHRTDPGLSREEPAIRLIAGPWLLPPQPL